jgi:hypothetical protein
MLMLQKTLYRYNFPQILVNKTQFDNDTKLKNRQIIK